MSIRHLGVAAGCALTVLTAAAIATGPPSSTLEPVVLAGPLAGDAHPAAAPTPPKPKPKPKPAATSAAAANRTCNKGFTQGRIGGVSKCLAAGQQCQQTHAADYTRYGLTCTGVKGVFRLHSKTAAPRKLAHPAVRKPAVAAKPAAPKKP